MKNSKEIIELSKVMKNPDKGIIALAQYAYDNPDWCPSDKSYLSENRGICPDRCSCHRADFMLSCIQIRDSMCSLDELGEQAIKIYNNAVQ